MKSLFIDKEFLYDGTQLRSLYAYLEHKLQGDSVVSWIGPCSVSFDHMVDGEDLLDRSAIAGSKMVHFIIEKFHQNLFAGVAVQRLFSAICLDLLRNSAPDPKVSTWLRRDGDDLFFGEGKLSISIATVSPMSTLIHFAVNCTNAGTPVKTASLAEDLGIDPVFFAKEAMERLTRELHGIEEATVKVRWVP